MLCEAWDDATETWNCPLCSTSFSHKGNLSRHVKNVHQENLLSMKQGISRCSASYKNLCYACGICSEHFESRKQVLEHRANSHIISHDFSPVQSSHNQQTSYHRLYFDPMTTESMDDAFYKADSEIFHLFQSILGGSESDGYYKTCFLMTVEMYKTDGYGHITTVESFAFRSQLFLLRFFTDIKREIALSLGDIERSVEEFLFRGSGWRILQPLFIDVQTFACFPLAGGSCNLHIACHLRGKGISIDQNSLLLQGKEKEGLCLYYAIAAFFCGKTNVAQLDSFIQVWGKPAGPNVSLQDIHLVEEAWKALNISINVVYRDEQGRMLPVRSSPRVDAENEIVLLLFHVSPNSSLCHYALVEDPSNFFSRRTVWGKGEKARCYKKHICWNCANIFGDKEILLRHKSFCHQNNCQRVEMPSRGEKISFTEENEESQSVRRRTFKSGLMLFYDFECLQIKKDVTCRCEQIVRDRTLSQQREEEQWKGLSHEEKMEFIADRLMEEGEEERRDWEEIWYENRCKRKKVEDDGPLTKKIARLELSYLRLQRKREKKELWERQKERQKICRHKTHFVADHVPFSYCMVLIDREGKIHYEKTYVGMDAAENFVGSVLKISDRFLPSLLTPGQPMKNKTENEIKKLKRTKICYLCFEFMEETHRVIDHDHLTGEILGIAHSTCNLARREQCRITSFCHNFQGYDSHLLIRDFNKHPKVKTINAIPLNTERFKCFTINNRIHFLDSYAFLPDSLASIVNNMKASGENKFSFISRMTDGSERQKQLLLRKGVFPYSFLTSLERVKSSYCLPSRKEFYNELTGEEIKEEDYIHAQTVWKEFNCITMEDYTKLYVRCDVYQMAEAVIDFRNNVWREFGLDICQYLSLPMLAKDIMLKITRAEMELIHDHEMSNLIQKNIRGGLSFINTRKVERDENLILLYVDANNLYGKAMTFPLPLRDFQWMEEEEINSFNPETHANEGKGWGYILEVDLEYPEHLHLEHNSFPLAPHSLRVASEDLSEYARACLYDLYHCSRPKSEKLSSTMNFRHKYVLHSLNLRLYLRLGLKLKKIHRGIKFYQEEFIRPYIEMCTQKRKEAPTESLKNMYKLLANSLYGKLIEGVASRMNCVFNRGDREKAMKTASSPLFKGSLICDQDLTISFLKKKVLRMRQNWAVGFSVLELSKYVMQDLFYNVIRPSLGKRNVSVVMSDTDSFLLAVKAHCEDEVMKKLSSVMDFSNYEKSHFLYDKSRAKDLGLLKNEMPHASIKQFIGLKSKTYIIETDCSSSSCSDFLIKAKGVPNAFRKKLPIESMGKCLKYVPPSPTSVIVPKSCPEKGRKKIQRYIQKGQGEGTHEIQYFALQSKKHVNHLVKGRKLAFSAYDDKRYLMCPIHSAPYGSVLIQQGERDKKEEDQWPCYFCQHPDILV